MENPSSQFERMEKELKKIAPHSVESAHNLASAIVDPRTADADGIFKVMWDKPLWANANSRSIEGKLPKASPLVLEEWRQIGEEDSDFCIFRKRRGRSNDCFDIAGQRAITLSQNVGIARYRLFAIQGAAQYLKVRPASMEQGGAVMGDLLELSFSNRVERLSQELGDYWGPITVLHFLTDIGLAIKPDRHVVKTARHLRLIGDNENCRTSSIKEYERLYDEVVVMCHQIYGEATPPRLRYVDKMMMNFSVHHLVD